MKSRVVFEDLSMTLVLLHNNFYDKRLVLNVVLILRTEVIFAHQQPSEEDL